MKTILKKIFLFWLSTLSITGFAQTFTKKWATCLGGTEWDEATGLMQVDKQIKTSIVVEIKNTTRANPMLPSTLAGHASLPTNQNLPISFPAPTHKEKSTVANTRLYCIAQFVVNIEFTCINLIYL